MCKFKTKRNFILAAFDFERDDIAAGEQIFVLNTEYVFSKVQME